MDIGIDRPTYDRRRCTTGSTSRSSLANEFLRQTTLDLLDARGVSTALKATDPAVPRRGPVPSGAGYGTGSISSGSIPLVDRSRPGRRPAAEAGHARQRLQLHRERADRDQGLVAASASAVTYGRATPMAANMLLAEVVPERRRLHGTRATTPLALTAAQAVIAQAWYQLESELPAQLHGRQQPVARDHLRGHRRTAPTPRPGAG